MPTSTVNALARTALLGLALGAAACATPADTYRSILPDDRLLIDGFDDASVMRGVGEASDYYGLTRQVVTDTNTSIGDVLGLVNEITSFDPTWTDDESTALWGPWLDSGLYGQLWVTHAANDDYDWAIEFRPEDSDEDAWVPVLAGHVDAGSDDTHSTGWFGLDFTAADSMDASDEMTGQLACQYELQPDGAVATVGYGQISEDGSVPQDGAVHYEHTIGEGGLMDVALTQDISDPANGTLELTIVRSRWDGTGAGRADAYVTQGDLGPLTYTETDCWDAGHATVYLENNFELIKDGDAAKCAFAEPSFNEQAR